MLVAACAAFGLLVGSFLTVVIVRVPAGDSVVRHRSRCPGCGSAIAVRDSIPVVSWLLLHARARCCTARVSALYPLVEVGTAVAFALVAVWVQPAPGALTGAGGPASGVLVPEAWRGSLWPLPAFLYLAAVSVALAVIDVQHRRLPFWIVVPSWWIAGGLLGAAALLMGRGDAAVRMVLGGLAYWVVYRLLYGLGRGRWIGFGDVRLAGLLGVYLAWVSWGVLAVGAYLAMLVAGAVFVALLLARRVNLKTALPYGPSMVAGAWLSLIFGPQLLSTYLGV